MSLRRCSRCAALTSGLKHKTLGVVCTLCLEPLPWPKKKPKEKPKTKATRATRQREAFVSSHAGYPLGAGYPSGSPLREDGESHREAWYRTLRADPCSYCARVGGTIDHVDPQSGVRPLYGLHSWLNVTGACASCNQSKGAQKLLLWLAPRAISARGIRDH